MTITGLLSTTCKLFVLPSGRFSCYKHIFSKTPLFKYAQNQAFLTETTALLYHEDWGHICPLNCFVCCCLGSPCGRYSLASWNMRFFFPSNHVQALVWSCLQHTSLHRVPCTEGDNQISPLTWPGSSQQKCTHIFDYFSTWFCSVWCRLSFVVIIIKFNIWNHTFLLTIFFSGGGRGA